MVKTTYNVKIISKENNEKFYKFSDPKLFREELWTNLPDLTLRYFQDDNPTEVLFEYTGIDWIQSEDENTYIPKPLSPEVHFPIYILGYTLNPRRPDISFWIEGPGEGTTILRDIRYHKFGTIIPTYTSSPGISDQDLRTLIYGARRGWWKIKR